MTKKKCVLSYSGGLDSSVLLYKLLSEDYEVVCLNFTYGSKHNEMEKDNKTSITPTENGPYIVTGLDNLANRKGSVEAEETVALCRCGGSNNKPFCDGTHAKIGFSSEKHDDRVPDAPRMTEIEHQSTDNQQVSDERGQNGRSGKRAVLLDVQDVHHGADRETTRRQTDATDDVKADPQSPGKRVTQVRAGAESPGETNPGRVQPGDH